MKKQTKLFLVLVVVISFVAMYGNAFATPARGAAVDTACAPATPYGGNCAICHNPSDPNQDQTPGFQASLDGGTALTDYFCPATPTCTDNDGDNFAVEGGDCGPVDCDDTSASVYPGATEICGDGIDQDCNGSDLACTDGTNTGAIPPALHLLKEDAVE